MHSSLVVKEQGLRLVLAAVKFWNRDKFKDTAQLKRKINPTRVPIEAKERVALARQPAPIDRSAGPAGSVCSRR